MKANCDSGTCGLGEYCEGCAYLVSLAVHTLELNGIQLPPALENWKRNTAEPWPYNTAYDTYSRYILYTAQIDPVTGLAQQKEGSR